MAYTPQDVRILGKVPAGADNVQIRVAADGKVCIFTDAASPLHIVDLVAGKPTVGDSVLVYGSDDLGDTPRVLKTNAAGELVVSVAATPGGTDFFKPGVQAAIAAAATVLVVSEVPLNGETLRVDFIGVKGSGSFYWEVREFDGVGETVKARGYTAPGAPHNRIDMGRRYTLVGDGVKALRVYAQNIDITLQADAAAEIVGNK